jgi:uncharacterized protein
LQYCKTDDVNERLLTPSKITAWLDCPYYLTLRHRVDAGALVPQRGPFGAMAQLLLRKGQEHEAACLEEYRTAGRSVYVVPGRGRGERFEAWVQRAGNPLADGHDVIYQMPFIHDRVRGIADFLLRTERHDGGVGYEPVDAKLARAEARPGHVLQLCFYAEAIEALTGSRPEHLHLWLGSGALEAIRLAEVAPYWRRLRQQLVDALDRDIDESTRPEPCAHCDFCEFADHCEGQWRAEDSLVYVAGIRANERAALERGRVATLASLATLRTPVDGVDPARELRLVEQAALQVVARERPDEPPPYALIDTSGNKAPPKGLAALPIPDSRDVFLDYEGDPFWRADTGLFFLFGVLEGGGAHTISYDARWAHDLDEEAEQTRRLVEYLAARHDQYPDMHVYHYNHTERSALERLAALHGVGEATLAELVDGGLFVDLLAVVRAALLAGVESYGLKSIELLTAFERSHVIDRGAGAVLEYEAYMVDCDPSRLERIAGYNRDDVESTRQLRDWLVGLRPAEMAWRAAFVPVENEEYAELDAQVQALHGFSVGTHQRLLGDVLGYWRREWRATLAQMLAKTSKDADHRLEDPDVISDLQFLGPVDRQNATGKALTPGLRFRYPAQSLSTSVRKSNAGVVFDAGGNAVGFSSIGSVDQQALELELLWGETNSERGVIPSVVVFNNWVQPKPKPQALSSVAAVVLDESGGQPTVGEALLRRELPAFTGTSGPTKGAFDDDLAAILSWAPALDRSYVAIQGPPGTGKTYTGAHIVLELIRRGQRVGITAMSHYAIDNLLGEVIKVARASGQLSLVRAVRRHHRPKVGALEGVTYTDKPEGCAKPEYNLVAGTTWVFASKVMRAAPVDVLIVDEAGQLALADALAASTSANNLILLGDPSQLAQVSQAVHPGGSGASVLEHVLGADVTIPPERGVFLAQTRRMHPDVCRFISDQIYEGRLTSHSSCAGQSTGLGTGLRWIRASHSECSTASPEEAELILRQLELVLGSWWIDAAGDRHELGPDDVLVVAPYNDQVDLLRDAFDGSPIAEGARVGTVDKFQGQEAPVVFFSMTTSSAADMPRGPAFLFSKNRLNVAISRARCVAFLVCTEKLLNARASDVEQMKLIATLCAFVEQAQPVG